MSAAVVTKTEDGCLVLDDPAALEVFKAVGLHDRKIACRATFEGQAERVAYFSRRLRERGDSSKMLIVLINADDPIGRGFAEALMPAHDWQSIRDLGQVPYARGLAGRAGIQEALDALDVDAATKLRRVVVGDQIAVVVIDHETCDVFTAPEAAIDGSSTATCICGGSLRVSEAMEVPEVQCRSCGKSIFNPGAMAK